METTVYHWTRHAIREQKTSHCQKFRNEIKALNKDLNRKNQALAETAALLVLKKKVDTTWGNDEGNLP